MIQIEVYRPATAEEPLNRLMVDNENLPGCYTWYEANEKIKELNAKNYRGFNNWRLPTKEELNEMYQKKDKIVGFTHSLYWCSTENNEDDAWLQDFIDGDQYVNRKFSNIYVRLVRSINQ